MWQWLCVKDELKYFNADNIDSSSVLLFYLIMTIAMFNRIASMTMTYITCSALERRCRSFKIQRTTVQNRIQLFCIG